MPKTGTSLGEEALYRLDRVGARLGIARSVREKYAVRVQVEHVVGRGLRRHDRHPATVVRQQAQDVALDAEIVGDDMQALARAPARGLLERPVGAFVPLVGRVGGDDFREIHALEAGKALGRGHCKVGALRRIAARDAAGLRALLAQDARQPAGVDFGDGDDVPAHEELGQRFGRPPAGVQQRQVANDQPGRVDRIRLEVVGIRAGVADVGIGQCDDLPGVRGVREDFLVSGHGGVEHHFARRSAGCTNGHAAKHGAVLESQNSGCRHGVTSVAFSLPVGKSAASVCRACRNRRG